MYAILNGSQVRKKTDTQVWVLLKQDFKFFREKIKESKNKEILTAVLHESTGERLEICIGDGAEVTGSQSQSGESKTAKKLNEIIDIFDGKIIVKQDSQKIESSQSNKNLLLSQNARIHSNPQLEINADDVKCSHGSTTGQLDDDALFYLQSRGLSKNKSQKMLIEGFANDILEKIKYTEIREYISGKISRLIQEETVN